MYIAIILSIIIPGIVYLVNKVIKYNKQLREVLKTLLKVAYNIRDEIEESYDLTDMYNIHKSIFMHFKRYYIPVYINVSKFGCFRSDSTDNLKPDNIYLGNIFGINTNNLSWWIHCNDDTEAKRQIEKQYKLLLLTAVDSIINKIIKDMA
jgi:hypothetical protein